MPTLRLKRLLSKSRCHLSKAGPALFLSASLIFLVSEDAIRLKTCGSVPANPNTRDHEYANNINRYASAKIGQGPESAKQPERDMSEEVGRGRVFLCQSLVKKEYLDAFIRWVKSRAHIYTTGFLSSGACLRFFGLETYGNWVGPRIPARKGTWEGSKGRERGLCFMSGVEFNALIAHYGL